MTSLHPISYITATYWRYFQTKANRLPGKERGEGEAEVSAGNYF